MNLSKFSLTILFSFAILCNVSFAKFDTDLKSGSKGTAVTELQEALIGVGFLKVSANGMYGPATTKAVKDFQKKYNITQTGTIGPKTRAKLKELYELNLAPEIQNILKKDSTVSVWIPYWRKTGGSEQVKENITKVDIVSPFSFEINASGTLNNPMKLNEEPYSSLIKISKDSGKLIVPTVLWFADSEAKRKEMHNILSATTSRVLLEDNILNEVKNNNLDGIDIDFENKLAETKDYFSLFLKEISIKLHNEKKMLICTIEARTPIDSRLPNATSLQLSQVEYANDFKKISEYCDQVRIMAYDQFDDDKNLLNSKNNDGLAPYRPVADIDWVKKVVTLALKDIPAKKLIIGVPTYGYKYKISRDVNGRISSYKRLGSMNWFYADEEARNKSIIPTRDSTGELSYTYADPDGSEYYVVYSDAEAIVSKIDLVKKMKLGGISIFKIDGNNDKTIWNKI